MQLVLPRPDDPSLLFFLGAVSSDEVSIFAAVSKCVLLNNIKAIVIMVTSESRHCDFIHWFYARNCALHYLLVMTKRG